MALDVAQTILAQLGGQRFSVMTGASRYVGSATALSFRLPSTPHFVKDRINFCAISLTWRDTYTVEFFRRTKTAYTLVTTCADVYAEDLQACFTRITGLETHL
jgi:hypothetical protein